MNDTETIADEQSSDATEKETPHDSSGTENVASDEVRNQAGGEQSSTEGGSAEEIQTRKRGPSKLDTIRELRARIRDERSQSQVQIQNLTSQIEELRGLMTERGQSQKPSKTFWEAPEEVLEERLTAGLSALEKRMLQRLEERQQNDQQTSEWKQETSEAAEFVKNQKGLTDDDLLDIKEIVDETPAMRNLRPLERARYALYLWQQQRGISDKTSLKAKAGTVMGQSAASQNGKKVWDEEAINAEIQRRFHGDPQHWTPEQHKNFDKFYREIRSSPV